MDFRSAWQGEVCCLSWKQVDSFVVRLLPLCCGFLVLYSSKSPQKWAVPCPGPFLSSALIFRCLSYCGCPTTPCLGEYTNYHEWLPLKLVLGCPEGEDIFFTFSALFPFCWFFFFLNKKHIIRSLKKQHCKRGQQWEDLYGRKIT